MIRAMFHSYCGSGDTACLMAPTPHAKMCCALHMTTPSPNTATVSFEKDEAPKKNAASMHRSPAFG